MAESQNLWKYSRTSRKPPPKMLRLSGRLREAVAYGRWSLTRIEQQGVFSEKRSGHIYFVEDNLLQAISKLSHVQFHVVTKFFVHFEYSK